LAGGTQWLSDTSKKYVTLQHCPFGRNVTPALLRRSPLWRCGDLALSNNTASDITVLNRAGGQRIQWRPASQHQEATYPQVTPLVSGVDAPA